MGTKMKGLLKGLRYISQKLDNKDEEEMQIGLPTDVKHVAHIGWDGPSVGSPSWMGEFRAPSVTAGSGGVAGGGSGRGVKGQSQPRRADPNNLVGGTDSRAGEPPSMPLPRPPARRDINASADSPNLESAATSASASGSTRRPSRRQHASSSVSGSVKEPSEGSRQGRRNRSTSANNYVGGGSDPQSQQQEGSVAAKQTRRRRPKGSTEVTGIDGGGGGSVRRSSRSKAISASVSDPGLGDPNIEPLRSALPH